MNLERAVAYLMYGLKAACKRLDCNIQKFKEAENPVDAVQWHAKDAMCSYYLQQKIKNFIEDINELEGKTEESIREFLLDAAERTINQLLISTTYQPRSTSPEVNCCLLAEYRAEQSFAQLVKMIVRIWEEVSSGKQSEENLSSVSCMYFI